MRRILLIILLIPLVQACYKGETVDLVVHNAKIHSMNNNRDVYQAMAIKDGKIVELGPERQILNKYSAEEELDAQGKEVYPGFTDAHAHIISYANQKLSADLVGSTSMDDLLVRTELYQQKFKREVVIGRGWDQSLWGVDSLPNNEKLNKVFPDVPVCLSRIDGHAMLVNDAMLKLAGIKADTLIEGGIIHLQNGKPTGMLIDNAMDPVFEVVPAFSDEELTAAIAEIQQELFQYGITGVHEAGIAFKHIDMFKRMIDSGVLKLNLYAMLMPGDKNREYAKKEGIVNYKNLTIRSFKVYGDGALGSRGALLKKPYFDEHDHHGVLTSSLEDMKEVAALCRSIGYQMNSHAIGDSTNYLLLDIYKDAYALNPDHRWRIEHAQVIDPEDIVLFKDYGVFPSVQPTHAVSDQRWALQRLGEDRMKGAYAYQSLLEAYGMLALGTDFPVELTNPFLTIHAAVNRKNADGVPGGGFYMEQAISLDDCLMGMTYWTAVAAFNENELGSLVDGKDATFAIFDLPVNAPQPFVQNFALYTYIKGQKVYSTE